MRRTNRIKHDENTRKKIQAAQLINRLTACAMGEVEMTGPQVKAATSLLDKVLPTLKQVDMDANIGGDVFEEWLKKLK